MIDLKDLNIILTGSTGGIGGSILKKLHDYNAKIIATGTNEDKLNEIKKNYENVIIRKFDISNHSSIDNFVDECDKVFQNKINVLINNAGITLDNLTIRMKDEEWKRVLDINLTSSFLLSKFAIKKMLRIKSEMTDKIAENFKKTMEEKISLGRFGMPEDVANAVAFLSSNLSDYITGETIHVNGGMYFS